MARYLHILSRLMIVGLVASAALFAVPFGAASCGGKRRPAVSPFDEDVVVGSLAILPIPSKAVPERKQDHILMNLAEALSKKYKLPVITGLTLGRAVFGELTSDGGVCIRTFRETVAEARDAQKRLQFNKAIGLFDNASQLLPRCGAEIRKPKRLQDVFMYMGLMLVTLERVEEAEAAFRQLAAFDKDFEPPGDLFRLEQVEVYERAQRALLSGNPFDVEILSWPEGATVHIDGRRIGEAPLRVPLYLGKHFVRITLKGHAPYLLNIPNEAPPKSIKAWLFPVWPDDDLPDDLMEEFIEGEAFSDTAYKQLARVATQHKVDAVLVSQFGMKGKKVQLAARLYIAKSDLVVREGVYNLGATDDTHQTRIDHLVKIFKELKKRKRKKPKPGVSKPPKPAVKPAAKPEPKPEPKPKPKPKPKKRKKKKKKKKYTKPPVEEIP
jgi:tetratricopeptide (TPR) repeat protein